MRITKSLIFLLFLAFSLNFISAIFVDCSIYGNCKPTTTGTTNINNTYQNVTNVYQNITQVNNYTTPMDYTNIMMQNQSNNVTGNFKFNGGNVTSSVFVLASTTDLIPTMTSNTAPSGVAWASSYYIPSDFQPFKAFDDNTGTTWASGTSSGEAWLAYNFTIAKIVKRYTLKARSDGSHAQMFNNYVLEAKTNGAWTTLDTQTGLSWSSGEKKTFDITNENAYIAYRIRGTSSGGYCAVLEMEMLEGTDGYITGTFLSIENSAKTSNVGKLTVGNAVSETIIKGNTIEIDTASVTPKTTSLTSLGSSLLRWLKGWFVDLDVSGNINHTGGNATINTYYATLSFYNQTGIDAGTLNDTYQTLAVFGNNRTSFRGNGFTYNSNGLQLLTDGGIYTADWIGEGYGTQNHIYEGDLFVNNIAYNLTDSVKGTANNEVRLTGRGHVRVNKGDNITIKLRDIGDTSSGTAIKAIIKLDRVGNI